MLHTMFIAIAVAVTSQEPAKYEYSVQENIVYSKVEERELLLDAYLPKKDGVSPAMLVVHGGAWRFGDRKQLQGYAQELSKMGIACFAIDYRLAPQHKFPAQIEDCRAAVKWIRTNSATYKVNPKKLGAIGYSAGGHLASLLGTTGEAPSNKNGNVDSRLQVVIAGGAPTDFRWFPDKGKWAEFLMGGDLDTVPDNFLAASSSAFADKDDAPTFFFNGTEDRLVPLPWSQSCYGALKSAGVRTEFYKIEGAGHREAARNPEALAKAYEFLKAELFDEAPAESDATTSP